MDGLRKLYYYIIAKDLIPLGLVIIFLILFRPIWEKLFRTKIVDNFLANISSDWSIDLLLFVSIILMIVFTFFRAFYIGFKFSKKWNILIFTLFTIYTVYRVCSLQLDNYPIILTRSWLFNSLFYADVFFGAIILNQFLKLFVSWHRKSYSSNKNNNTVSNKRSFYEDNPTILGDELKRNPFAKEVLKLIRNSEFEKAFSIGITGDWGSGKTTFIEYLRNEIRENNDFIEIDFQPWRSKSSNQIIADFFELLREEIKPYNASIGGSILSYSTKLQDIDPTFFLRIFNATGSLLGFDRTAGEMYAEIQYAITGLQKRIVIFIDDIDRLDSREILEVLKLIRNTANFKKIIFVVTYDKKYVINTIKVHSKSDFLEKFFQLEIPIPYFNKVELIKELCIRLKSNCPNEYHKNIEEFLLNSYDQKVLCKHISTFRDVTRLVNSIILNCSLLFDEVNIKDFIIIELLRIKHKRVWELLKWSDSDVCAYMEEVVTDRRKLALKVIPNQESKGAATYTKTVLYSILIEKLNYEVANANDCLELVCLILPIQHEPLSRQISDIKGRSVCYLNKHPLYFAFHVLEGILSDVEYKKAFSKSKSDFLQEIDKWVDKGLEVQLENKFKFVHLIDDCNDESEFKKTIEGIFHMARKMNSAGNNNGFSKSKLRTKISSNREKIIEKFFNNDENKLYDYLVDLFNSSNSPFIFDSQFLGYLNESNDRLFPVYELKRKEILLSYLKKYINEINEFDRYVWWLFNSCKKNAGDKKLEFYPEAQVLMKKLVIKDIDYFLLRMIGGVYAGKKRTFSLHHNFLRNIFGSLESFHEFLKNTEFTSSDYILEFLEFYNKLSKSEFKGSVEFQFQVIPVQDKFS